jgi:hypothetical protein
VADSRTQAAGQDSDGKDFVHVSTLDRRPANARTRPRKERRAETAIAHQPLANSLATQRSDDKGHAPFMIERESNLFEPEIGHRQA